MSLVWSRSRRQVRHEPLYFHEAAARAGCILAGKRRGRAGSCLLVGGKSNGCACSSRVAAGERFLRTLRSHPGIDGGAAIWLDRHLDAEMAPLRLSAGFTNELVVGFGYPFYWRDGVHRPAGTGRPP